MAIVFRQVDCGPLTGLDATAPDGAVIGIVGENGSGKGSLLRLAAAFEKPVSGTVEAGEPRRLLCWPWNTPWRGATPWNGSARRWRWNGCGVRGLRCC
jgi:hypothetical protein